MRTLFGVALALACTAAPAAALEFHAVGSSYSYDPQTRQFTGNDGALVYQPMADHGHWSGGGAEGAVLGLESIQAVDDSVPGVLSHAWLVFDLVGSRTGEWWAFVNLQDPLGPHDLGDLFTTAYTDVVMPLHSFLVFNDTHAVPEPGSWWLLIFGGALLAVIRWGYRP